jgi:hypothetical protein
MKLPKAYAQAPELSGQNRVKQDPVQEPPPNPRERATWRQFLGAAKTVADSTEGAVPFDLAAISGESLSCLVLEIWFSEIWLYLRRLPSSTKNEELERFVESISRKSWARENNEGLGFAVKHFSFQLYRAWLLLVDTIRMDRLINPNDPFHSVSRMADQKAIASRHWYKTASIEGEQGRDVVVVGLPGRFSVRGDWYLGVAGNSRSLRLADRACDLLSSGRANFDRIQLGVGLPTRGIVDDDLHQQIRTSIRSATYAGPLGQVTYGSLVGLGATGGATDGEDDNFFWLWRSQLKDYDSEARIWNKWLVRVAIAWHQLRDIRPKYPWVGGFTIYDLLDRYEVLPPDPLRTAEWDPKSDISEWQEARKVSHHQFLNSWDAFNSLCITFLKLIRANLKPGY